MLRSFVLNNKMDRNIRSDKKCTSNMGIAVEINSKRININLEILTLKI